GLSAVGAAPGREFFNRSRPQANRSGAGRFATAPTSKMSSAGVAQKVDQQLVGRLRALLLNPVAGAVEDLGTVQPRQRLAEALDRRRAPDGGAVPAAADEQRRLPDRLPGERCQIDEVALDVTVPRQRAEE